MRRYLLVGWLLLLALSGCALVPGSGSATPTPPVDYQSLFPRNGMLALDHVPALGATEGSAYLAPQSLVIGVVLGDEARAYPIDLLGRHEVANDTLGGQPILVTYCPLCNSGIVTSRRVQTAEGPRELTFEVSGKVLDEALVMIDRETESLWPQSRAAALSGPLTGSELELLANQQMAWSDWRAAYPSTTVVIPPQAASSTSFELPTFGEAPQTPHFDPAWSGYVVGVSQGEQALALPLEAIAEAEFVQLELGGQPLLAVAGSAPGEVLLWRGEAGRTYTAVGGELRADGTDAAWDSRSGEPLSAAASAPLDAVEGQLMHWRAWWSWHPDSQLWPPGE